MDQTNIHRLLTAIVMDIDPMQSFKAWFSAWRLWEEDQITWRMMGLANLDFTICCLSLTMSKHMKKLLTK